MIAAADRILKLAGPKTKIIPGHGPIGSPADLAAFRGMLLTLHDRLAPMIDAGKTTEEAIVPQAHRRPRRNLGQGVLPGGCSHASPTTAARPARRGWSLTT